MPFITYTTVEGALNEEEKAALVGALTDAVAHALGDTLRPNIWVTLNEAPEGNFAIGGKTLKAQTLRKLMQRSNEHA